jgi:hypothetical protein
MLSRLLGSFRTMPRTYTPAAGLSSRRSFADQVIKIMPQMLSWPCIVLLLLPFLMHVAHKSDHIIVGGLLAGQLLLAEPVVNTSSYSR